VSAAAEQHRSAAELLREASRALAPCARCDGGLTVSGSTAAALAELFRLLAREGEPPEVAGRAARRVLADLGGAGTAPATTPSPRAPADTDGGVLAAR
jgi:hypothetical protein